MNMDIQRMLSWLITTKSHAVVMFDNEGMPYSPEDEETFKAVYALIESSGGEKHPLVENMVDMTPEQHRAANDCLRELIHGEPAPSLGPSVEEKSGDSNLCMAYVDKRIWPNPGESDE